MVQSLKAGYQTPARYITKQYTITKKGPLARGLDGVIKKEKRVIIIVEEQQ